MRPLISRLSLALALACGALAGAAAPAGATAPAQPCAPAGEPDWLGVVGPYPPADTLDGQSERAVLLWLQNARTGTDVARAQGEGTPSLGCFAGDIHRGAAPGSRPIDLSALPLTSALLEHARQDFEPILDGLRNTFARPGRNALFHGLTPALPMGGSPSYPSRHAALGVAFARILGQLDVPDRPALDATGRLLGTDRVLGGVHYPSDVEAGQRLGRAFATWWLDQPEHLKLLQTCCPEWE